MNYSRLLSVSILFVFLSSTAESQSYFQQDLKYNITASLDTTSNTLEIDSKLLYTNNSDTKLDHIYFHVWWNCFSDKTSSFADQQLAMGMKEFYFAKDEEMGGYEELVFKMEGKTIETQYYIDENNKELIDVVRLDLLNPLVPGGTAEISIHSLQKIPALFSRGGRQEDLYRFTQWYPKPAVFDKEGWHPMPYLAMGEYFSEYGDYDLTFKVPRGYDLVSTGEVISEEQIGEQSVISIQAKNVPDIAWFCSDSFIKKTRMVEVGDKQIPIHLYTNFEDSYETVLGYMEDGLKFYSEEVSGYPYPHYSLVLSKNGNKGGMEYPMLSVIDMSWVGQTMDNLVAHEIGHNWFQSILGSNERKHPWLDEGLNSFYERRYNDSKYDQPNNTWLMPNFMRQAKNEYSVMQAGVCHLHCCGQLGAIDQPSAKMEIFEYATNSYEKTAFSLNYLEAYLGADIFAAAMKSYYTQWAHQHPGPADLRTIFEQNTDKNLSWFFDGLIGSDAKFDYGIDKVETGSQGIEIYLSNKQKLNLPIQITAYGKDNVVLHNKWVDIAEQHDAISIPLEEYSRISINGETPFLDLNRMDNHYHPGKLFKTGPVDFKLIGQQRDSYRKSISWLPALSYNNYNGLMLGLELHNNLFPYSKTRWHVQPAYGFKSGTLAGLYAVERDILFTETKRLQKLTFGVSGRRFGSDVRGLETVTDFFYDKLSPSLTLHFDKGFSASQQLQYRIHYVNQQSRQQDNTEASPGQKTVLHQLNFRSSKSKRLMRIENLIQLEYEAYSDVFEVPKHYLKLSMERMMSLNYTEKSQLHLRLFGGYFLSNSQRESSSYTGVFTRGSFALSQQGYTDHTFEGFYFSRSEQLGTFSRQISIEEGGFKMPLGSSYNFDMSNDYMLAMNFKIDVPFTSLKYFRLRPFLDLAYYSSKATLSDPLSGKFLYASGLSLEIGNVIGVYVPIVYSGDYDIPFLGRGILDKISFMIDLNKLRPWRVIEDPGFLLR